MDRQALEFSAQFATGVAGWIETVGVTALVAAGICYLVSALRWGPLAGGDRLWATFVSAVGDLVFISPRRVAALAWLGIKEATRRYVFVGLAIFVVILALGLWFLDPETTDPSAHVVDSVLTMLTRLTLLMAVLI